MSRTEARSGPDRSGRAAVTLRAVGNAVNLSTPLGLAVAAIGGCRVRRGPRRMLLADRYRRSFPYAGAFTVGNVVLTRGTWPDWRVGPPAPQGSAEQRLLQHEEAHTWQWLALGPLFLPAYTLAMGWSWLRTGDRSSANWFELRAGLEVGGYVQRPVRSWATTASEVRRRAAGLLPRRRSRRVADAT